MRYTFITGASSGIGKALAIKFAEKGYNLVLVARRKNLLEDLKANIEKDYRVRVVIKVADLTDANQVEDLYESLQQYDLETMINNAGLGDYSHVWDIDFEKAMMMLKLNVEALAHLSLKYVKDYKHKQATLLNVSSVGGYGIGNFAVTYCATKFFVSSFTEGIAQNLANAGMKMRAKVIAPGATTTEFVENAEKKAAFKGENLFTPEMFIPAEQLADYTYELYESDKIVGIVNDENELELKDPVFEYWG